MECRERTERVREFLKTQTRFEYIEEYECEFKASLSPEELKEVDESVPLHKSAGDILHEVQTEQFFGLCEVKLI